MFILYRKCGGGGASFKLGKKSPGLAIVNDDKVVSANFSEIYIFVLFIAAKLNMLVVYTMMGIGKQEA